MICPYCGKEIQLGRIFAVLAVFFVLIAILVAAGVVSDSSGFLDLSNIVAIAILGIVLVCSVVAAVTSLIYKLKMKALVAELDGKEVDRMDIPLSSAINAEPGSNIHQYEYKFKKQYEMPLGIVASDFYPGASVTVSK